VTAKIQYVTKDFYFKSNNFHKNIKSTVVFKMNNQKRF